jgi:purine-nucleoside phosphorylase
MKIKSTVSLLKIAIVQLLCLATAGCVCRQPQAGKFGNLQEYSQYNDTARQIFPDDYITSLKQGRFQHGELDHLPDCAIILHFADMESFLLSAGYQTNQWTEIATGTTDPNVLYVVHPKAGRPFLVNRGLPGAGGIATQTAELGALGVRKVVHIGTAGLLGKTILDADLVVSIGSYKDGAGVLLSDYHDGQIDPVAKPDPDLVWQIEAVLKHHNLVFTESTGYTVPIFYFQPSGLIEALLTPQRSAGVVSPGYIEMEEAPFFQTCKRMHLQAASIVVGSDRYAMADGELKHVWLGDTDEAVKTAFKSAVEALQNAP